MTMTQDTTTPAGRIIVLSAPSGCGKSTIINTILDAGDIPLRFSVSATNRSPRPGEQDGVHYHFMTSREFRDAVAQGEFVEWEEVYPGRYYGTLKRELRDAVDRGENIILDIDVKGAMSVKELFGDRALTVFIQPPGIAALRQRLEKRGTDAPEVIDQRIDKARYELDFAPRFDTAVVNDNLDTAVNEVRDKITAYLNN